MIAVATDRNTKYTAAIRHWMSVLGHATNLELLEKLRDEFPNLSATTVHRVTSRLVERGELQLAPGTCGSAIRLDANPERHDHFMCEHCGALMDANLRDEVRSTLERSIGNGCSISGNLTISGMCRKCQGMK